jgi:hypothetical protein
MAVHHLGVDAGNRARRAQPCLLNMVALDDLEGRKDQARRLVAWPGWRGQRAGQSVTVAVPQT